MRETVLAALPIDPFLPALIGDLERAGSLVLVAEPGAGKTTHFPRALLDSGLAGQGRILVLEPRRLAARWAARRVAEELGEEPGKTVGYQVRFEAVGGEETRLFYLTLGILTRRLAAQPSLPGVAAVVVDEFHERSLHADLELALLRRLQNTSRPDLKVVVMSATLDAGPVAGFLGGPVACVPGRPFPVAVEYAPRPDPRPLEQRICGAVRRAVEEGEEGDILVFLPGAAEIRRARQLLEPWLEGQGRVLALLHGDLPPAEQDRAVRPAGKPKVILSTNVAQTSLTIEGVGMVIDSGLAREAGHSPWSGLPTLETRPISQAAAEQRAGRAGRTRPGRCLRLYTQFEYQTRPRHDTPEILRADLAEAVLALAAAGESRPGEFPWFQPPAPAALAAASDLLGRLGAVSAEGQVTPLGRRMLELPLHPRAGKLALAAQEEGAGARGALLAALLGERDLRRGARATLEGGATAGSPAGPSDLLALLDLFEDAEAAGFAEGELRRLGLDAGSIRAVARARDQVARLLGRPRPGPLEREEPHLLRAILTAFPDRVGRRRAAKAAEVVLAGGGSGRLAPLSVVAAAEFLVAVEAEETRGRGRLIRLASAIDPAWLIDLFPERITETREARFDPQREQVEVALEMHFDGLVLASHPETGRAGEEAAGVLAEAALAAGIGRIWPMEEIERWKARVEFAARHDHHLRVPGPEATAAAVAGLCRGRRSFRELRDQSLLQAMRDSQGPGEAGVVERLAPERITLPAGRSVAVNYEPGKPPWIESFLQDFFGQKEGPRVAAGRQPLVLHLLAPSRRPVQVTSDLAGFWQRHYPAIRRELMRRYPRHSWPENPLTARPPEPRRRR